MPNWTGKWFFFLVIAFLIYTVAGGYAARWKQLLAKTSSLSNTITPTTPTQP